LIPWIPSPSLIACESHKLLASRLPRIKKTSKQSSFPMPHLLWTSEALRKHIQIAIVPQASSTIFPNSQNPKP
jgi:hypothetical protein